MADDVALQPIISLRRVTNVPAFSISTLFTTTIIEEYTNRRESKTTIFVSSRTRVVLSSSRGDIGHAEEQNVITVNIFTPIHNFK